MIENVLSPVSLKDTFDPLNLLLVFATVILGLRFPPIQQVLQREIPDVETPINRRNYRGELWNCIWTAAGPVVLVFLVSTYLFLPRFVGILKHSSFSLWNFEFERTAFVLLVTILISLSCASVILTVRLLIRIYKAR